MKKTRPGILEKLGRLFGTKAKQKIDPFCAMAADNLILDEDFDPSRHPDCPHCKSTDVATFIYGKPLLTRKILVGFENGQLISGG
ncbi:MAG: hypothetical protein C0622_02415 [Desulfuromonas sp.]|nr:MAG: hypothetical protein C0622_02415 [Desulfuromonas sp.]